MFKLLLIDEFHLIKDQIDIEVYQRIKNNQINRFEDFEDRILSSFKWYDIRDQESKTYVITMYITKDNQYIISESNYCYDLLKKIMREHRNFEKVLVVFNNEIIKEDIVYLNKFEEKITDIENELLLGNKKDCIGLIVDYRRELIKIKRYYEDLNEIYEGIVENQSKLIDESYIKYFELLDRKIDRLFSHVLTLRDYVTQVRETYQAQIDIEQNSLMKVFTLVTALFLPLTLIVGWYGMNLRMPEYSFVYGYPIVIILSVIVVVSMLLFFRRKKWF